MHRHRQQPSSPEEIIVPRYTVQCGYYAHSSNTVVVDAADPPSACENAILAANDCTAWRSSDHCTDTYIDALAEGEGISPWSANGVGSVLPIPSDYSEVAVLASRPAAAAADLERLLRGFVERTTIDGEIETTRQDWSTLHREASGLLNCLRPR
jgi:hypothetical protein